MHLHYSPFQFATAEQVSDYDISAKKIVKTNNKLTSKDTKKVHNLDSTMSCNDAAMITESPNAFISPNPVGTMKDMKTTMAPVGLCPTRAPKTTAPHYNDEYRTRGRVGYGDRASNLNQKVLKAGGGIN